MECGKESISGNSTSTTVSRCVCSIVVCHIHLPNFFEKTLLSDCPKVTMLGLHGQFSFFELWFMVIGNKILGNLLSQMQMSILLDNYALLNVRRVETSLLDDLALLWNRLLDWLILQTIYNRLYVIQLRSLYSNCYGSYSFICGHYCWLILWVWISGLKFSLPHICVVSYL